MDLGERIVSYLRAIYKDGSITQVVKDRKNTIFMARKKKEKSVGRKKMSH